LLRLLLPLNTQVYASSQHPIQETL